ncbi:MAG: hypothetical protein ACK5QT_08075 [Oligoflexia bacterium]
MKNQSAILVLALVSLSACGRGLDDQEEYAQSVGDVMSSMDESSGQTGGGFAYFRIPERLKPRSTFFDVLMPDAYAASCTLQSFSACASGVRTRTFGGCTFAGGRVTLSGTVSLTFSDTSSCTMNDTNESVTRTADFTISGRRGSLTVSAPGGGQTVTRTSSGFDYSVGGMKRVLKDSDGETIADIETRTLSVIAVTGTTRTNRVMNGGQLEIKNLTRGTTAVLTPSNLTWSANCNCAVSGSLSGTTSGDESFDDFKIEITGCGTATVSSGGASVDVEFDRCVGV